MIYQQMSPRLVQVPLSPAALRSGVADVSTRIRVVTNLQQTRQSQPRCPRRSYRRFFPGSHRYLRSTGTVAWPHHHHLCCTLRKQRPSDWCEERQIDDHQTDETSIHPFYSPAPLRPLLLLNLQRNPGHERRRVDHLPQAAPWSVPVPNPSMSIPPVPRHRTIQCPLLASCHRHY